MNFTQTVAFRCHDAQKLIELAAQWDENQAASDIMGYIGNRVLADRDDPGRYVMVADFGVVDPDVPAVDESLRNNDRPETREWAQKLLDIIDGEPEYRHYDEIYRTG